MGTKGSKLTQDSVLMAALLKERLNGLGDISTKKMFGGHGVFFKGKMFGIIDSKGQCYFKVNDHNKTDFIQHGSHQHGKMPYFSIPNEILDHSEKLLQWANKTLKSIKSQ